jgi:hypothetical protein
LKGARVLVLSLRTSIFFLYTDSSYTLPLHSYARQDRRHHLHHLGSHRHPCRRRRRGAREYVFSNQPNTLLPLIPASSSHALSSFFGWVGTGAHVTRFQFEETLPQEVLTKMVRFPPHLRFLPFAFAPSSTHNASQLGRANFAPDLCDDSTPPPSESTPSSSLTTSRLSTVSSSDSELDVRPSFPCLPCFSPLRDVSCLFISDHSAYTDLDLLFSTGNRRTSPRSSFGVRLRSPLNPLNQTRCFLSRISALTLPRSSPLETRCLTASSTRPEVSGPPVPSLASLEVSSLELAPSTVDTRPPLSLPSPFSLTVRPPTSPSQRLLPPSPQYPAGLSS